MAEPAESLNAGTLRAQAALAVDLSDPASRARARKLAESLGASAAADARSSVLSARILALAEADTGSVRVSGNLQRLATTLGKVDPAHVGGRRGPFGRLLSSPGRRAERVHAARKEIEGLVDTLVASAETLRQSEVALRAYEADIEAERTRVVASAAEADDFERALGAALTDLRATGAAAEVAAFVEREVRWPLEQRREHLRGLLALNQQAALAVGLMRETNAMLVEQVRQVSWATRHALDIASVLQGVKAGSQSSRDAVAPEPPATPQALDESLEQLAQTLKDFESQRRGASTRTQEALAELQDLSEGAPHS